MARLFGRWLTLLLVVLLPFAARAEVAVPALHQRVTDLTDTLAPDQVAALDARLAGLEQRSGAQVAILLVPTTQPEDIAAFSLRVVESWKLGQKGRDNGVLVLLAKQDRRSRIEVGYGLEGNIPDVTAKRILDDTAAPWFRQGDFNGGLNAIVSELAVAIEGRQMEASVPATRPVVGRDVWEGLSATEGRALGLMAGLFALAQLLRLTTGPLIAASVSAGIAAPSIGILAGSLAAGLGWGLFLFLLVLAFRFSWLSVFFMPSRGSSSWSSGSSGSSWSGGGGSFGGGGASGSW